MVTSFPVNDPLIDAPAVYYKLFKHRRIIYLLLITTSKCYVPLLFITNAHIGFDEQNQITSPIVI